MLNTVFRRLECAYSIFILVHKRWFILCARCDVGMGEALYQTGPAICEHACKIFCLILDSPFQPALGKSFDQCLSC